MVHDIDFMRWALGDIRSVYGLHRYNDDLDYASATLVFESGAVANLEAFWGYPGPFSTVAEIAGSKGVIRSDSQKTKSLHIRKKASSRDVKPFVEVPQSPSYHNPFELELIHFIECIRHNQEPIVTAQDAYKALEIALAVLESSSSGRVITFDRSTQEAMS
jgi:UDP-N-acetylglucosamine 3-dehydrogenase